VTSLEEETRSAGSGEAPLLAPGTDDPTAARPGARDGRPYFLCVVT
jgi:hypothetical protein